MCPMCPMRPMCQMRELRRTDVAPPRVAERRSAPSPPSSCPEPPPSQIHRRASQVTTSRPSDPLRPSPWRSRCLRRSWRLAALLLAFAAMPSLARAEAGVDGVVVTPDGRPVAGARVEVEGAELFRTTDQRGHFAFPETEPPVRLRVELPRFLPAPSAAEAAAEHPVRVVLMPRSEVYADIVVSAGRDFGEFEPVSVAAVSVSPQDRPGQVGSVVELIEGIPSVAEDGQGGLFQAYSIRGIAGQRVRTSIAGARIETERRAGSTASFLDPLLLGDADVVRGPSSTWYGSGALGGVVQLFPRRFEGLEMWAGVVAGDEEESFQAVGWGEDGWSLGVSHRRARDGETADGDRLFSRFEQWNLSLARTWELANGASLDLLLLPSLAEDIGKPNARIPERITSYPEESHLLARASYRHPARWRLDLFAHPNDLETLNRSASSRSVVANDALDFGLELEKALDFGETGARLGLELFGRRDVTATETVVDLGSGAVERARTLDGDQEEASLFGAVRRAFGPATIEVGGRWTWIEQSNRGAQNAASASDSALTGFVGLRLPVNESVELAANVGTGFRFPGLSERFFSGSTGRGEVLANADLDPERSLSIDTGVRLYGERLYLSAFVFRTEVDDYIERVRTPAGLDTYVNLTSGTIEGIELDGAFELSDALRLTWAGQTQRGRTTGGGALANVPSDRVEIGANWRQGRWTSRGRLQHRFSKDDPGAGEQAIGGADLLSLSVSHELGHGLTLRLSADNLLDESYLPSADDLAVAAAGRSFGLAVGWRPGAAENSD